MNLPTFRGFCLAGCLWASVFADDIAMRATAVGQESLQRQNFNFSNMDLRSAFRALSAAGGVDIVVSPTVGAQVVNLTLTDKTWREALFVLCQMYGLKDIDENNYLYVMNLSDYNKNNIENAEAVQHAGSMSPLIRDIVKLKNAKAKDLEMSVKGLLSQRGRINVVERSNAFLVFDAQQNIDEIRAAVRELDVETYQVNIQAQLIQADADAMREMGVDWQFGIGNGIASLINNPGKLPTAKNGTLGTSSFSPKSTDGSSAGSTVGGVAGATSQLAFGLFNGNLAVAVADLMKSAKGEILAKPQITTVDNTEARIFMGEQVPIRVLDVNGRQAIQLQDAGTSLTVTPHVTSDNRILLDLNPEKNSFRVDPQAGTILQRQSAKTSVVVNDGETVVIAGLTTKEEVETESGVPLLKDIPLLGWFFKHKSNQTIKRDLIIFVTPHIVRQSGVMDPVKNDSHSRSGETKPGKGVYGEYVPAKDVSPQTKPLIAQDLSRPAVESADLSASPK